MQGQMENGSNRSPKLLQNVSHMAPKMAAKCPPNGSNMAPGALLETSWLLLFFLCPFFGSPLGLLGALGGRLDAPEGLLEESGTPPERSWSFPGTLLDPPGDVLRAPGDLLEASRALLDPS